MNGYTVFYVQAICKNKRYEKAPDEVHEELAVEIARLYNHKIAQEGTEFLRKEVDEALGNLLEIDWITSSARALLAAGISGAWTAFECVATDAWVAALDARPDALAQRACDAPSDDDANGVRGKNVAVWQLAKNGFDLRNCMGRLLKPKFDFTGVSGIRKAYTAAFGAQDWISGTLADVNLSLLEASRHVVVHRAGVVDDEYAIRAAKMGATAAVGASLPLDGVYVTTLANSAVAAGREMIMKVDEWIEANPQ